MASAVSGSLHVNGYSMAEADLRRLCAEGRAAGKSFSIKQLVETSMACGAAPGRLELPQLERALALIRPNRLPPQRDDPHDPGLPAAVRYAYKRLESALQAVEAAAVPPNHGRLVVTTEGPLASSSQVVVAAHLPRTADGRRIARLKGVNTVYFEHLKFGSPPRYFGPFAMDALGIPIEAARPAVPDSIDEPAMLLALDGQKELRADLARGQLLTFDVFEHDVMTGRDVADYVKLSERVASRLSSSERAEVQDFWAYVASSVVNSILRGRNPERSAPARVLQSAFAKGVLLPPGLLLFRGMAADTLSGRSGKTLSDPGVVCTSLDPARAMQFADNWGRGGKRRVLMAIEVDGRVRALPSGNRGETEILLPPWTRLRIVQKTRRAGFDFYHLRTCAAGVTRWCAAAADACGRSPKQASARGRA